MDRSVERSAGFCKRSSPHSARCSGVLIPQMKRKPDDYQTDVSFYLGGLLVLTLTPCNLGDLSTFAPSNRDDLLTLTPRYPGNLLTLAPSNHGDV